MSIIKSVDAYQALTAKSRTPSSPSRSMLARWPSRQGDLLIAQVAVLGTVGEEDEGIGLGSPVGRRGRDLGRGGGPRGVRTLRRGLPLAAGNTSRGGKHAS